jgi:hypothetical protein
MVENEAWRVLTIFEGGEPLPLFESPWTLGIMTVSCKSGV